MGIQSGGINRDLESFEATAKLTSRLDPAGDLVKSASGLAMALLLDQGVYNFQSNAPQTPVAPFDPADITNKSYVDALIGGLKWKSPEARVAEFAGNINISSPPGVISGVALDPDDRVLLGAQTNGVQNGLWVFNGAGIAMTRPTDHQAPDDAAAHAIFVLEGGNGQKAYNQILTAIIDTDPQTWTQFAGTGTIIAGAGLTAVGNIFNVVAADASLLINADDMQVRISGTVPGLEVHTDGLRVSSGIAGDGLTGASGVPLEVQGDTAAGGDNTAVYVLATGVGINVTQLDGDHLTITWVPSNYTRNTSPPEANDILDLTAHLAGIDDALGGTEAPMKIVAVVLNATHISNRSVTLPVEVTANVHCWFEYLGTLLAHDGTAVTFTNGAAGVASLSWAPGVQGDGSPGGELAANDTLVIHYR